MKYQYIIKVSSNFKEMSNNTENYMYCFTLYGQNISISAFRTSSYFWLNLFNLILSLVHDKNIGCGLLLLISCSHTKCLLGRVTQLVTCLATDACLTTDPGAASSILVRSHTFVEIDHEMISTVILLPSADSFKKGCCQLQAKVCARITG